MNEVQIRTVQRPDINVWKRMTTIDQSHLTVARKMLLITAGVTSTGVVAPWWVICH